MELGESRHRCVTIEHHLSGYRHHSASTGALDEELEA
jgi:hypothetical protein